MSVVRIPRPEEDAFPWPRVAAVVVLGGALGLGLAYAGMERDRTIEAAEPTSGAEPVAEPVTDAPPAPGSTPVPEPDVAVDPAPDPGPDSGPQPTAAPTPEFEAAPADPTPNADAAPVLEADRPALDTGPVTLRPGRIAYLRCDGVPQRPGPFPCPRDEVLETAVWAALRSVEQCERAPAAGAADIVVDFEGEHPTIRARDTFPSDTVQTDAAALLACAGDSLENVSTSLSPRRLVVSFRLTLEDRAR